MILGTSTSGLDEGDTHVNLTLNGQESAAWQYPQQELGDPSRFQPLAGTGWPGIHAVNRLLFQRPGNN